MNVVVLACASRTSGAKTIYLQFLDHLKVNIGVHRYFIFVDESMPCPSIDGVTYLVVNGRTWIKRVFLDFFALRKILKDKNIHPSLIISFQNTGARCLRDVPQLIYYHQPIPLYPNKWSFFRSDERAYALYKNIYPFFVSCSFDKNNTDFVVQIPYIAESLINKIKIDRSRIHVLFPDIESIDLDQIGVYEYEKSTFNFVYPAVPAIYKEHKTLVEAIRIIGEKYPQEIKHIKVHLTLSIQQGEILKLKIKQYNLSDCFVFHGVVPHTILLSMINSSHGLLFPSTIETLGLPLIEAASLGKSIIVSDVCYSHQVIGEYEGVNFVAPYDYEKWAEQIRSLCTSSPIINNHYKNASQSSWNDFFAIVERKLNN